MRTHPKPRSSIRVSIEAVRSGSARNSQSQCFARNRSRAEVGPDTPWGWRRAQLATPCHLRGPAPRPATACLCEPHVARRTCHPGQRQTYVCPCTKADIDLGSIALPVGIPDSSCRLWRRHLSLFSVARSQTFGRSSSATHFWLPPTGSCGAARESSRARRSQSCWQS